MTVQYREVALSAVSSQQSSLRGHSARVVVVVVGPFVDGDTTLRGLCLLLCLLLDPSWMATLPCGGSACCCACCWTLRGWRHYLAGALLVVLVVGPVKIDRELQVPGGTAVRVLCCGTSLRTTARFVEGALLVVIVVDHLEFDACILNEERQRGGLLVFVVVVVVVDDRSATCFQTHGGGTRLVLLLLGAFCGGRFHLAGGGLCKVGNLAFPFRNLGSFLSLE